MINQQQITDYWIITEQIIDDLSIIGTHQRL